MTVSRLLEYPGDTVVLLAGNLEERAPRVVSLYQGGFRGHILLTNDGVLKGWSRTHQRNLYSIEQAEIFLIQSGVPANSIIKLPFYRSGTIYDALAVRNYLRLYPLSSILIVTSDYHAGRAFWTFKQVLANVPVSISVASIPSSWPSILQYIIEPIKTVYYRVRFGLFGFPV